MTDNAPVVGDTDDTSQPMPAMSTLKGGTIASGTYFQTQQLYYQGSSPSPTGTHQVTLVFDASQGTIIYLNGPNEFAGTYTTSGTSLTLDSTCGALMGQLTTPYTYSGGTLMLYDYTKNEVTVLQKQ